MGGMAVDVGTIPGVGKIAVAVGMGGTGVFVGGVTAGKLVESPGKVRLFISFRLVTPSPSESRFSIFAKAEGILPAALYAAPYGLSDGMNAV